MIYAVCRKPGLTRQGKRRAGRIPRLQVFTVERGSWNFKDLTASSFGIIALSIIFYATTLTTQTWTSGCLKMMEKDGFPLESCPYPSKHGVRPPHFAVCED